MGVRYVAVPPKPKSGWWEEHGTPPFITTTVFERDAEPEATGLFDARGNKLMKVTDRDPVGFVRFK
jgi:hypothetical protein